MKLVYGVGVNDASYPVTQKTEGKQSWVCPYYRVWRDMLKRCYDEAYIDRQPTYKGCSVISEWLTFSSFSSWMSEQDWKGNQLDKDLIYENNKVYSPTTCCFIDKQVNVFIADKRKNKDLPTGVTFHLRDNKFVAQCGNFLTGKSHLGYYDSPEAAKIVYTRQKKYLADILASRQTDQVVRDAILKRYGVVDNA